MKTAFVSLKAKNQSTAKELEADLLQLKKLSTNEEGIVQYEVFKSETDPLFYYVRESWSDQSTFEKHLSQPHLKQFGNDVTNWLTEPFTAILIQEII
jgi:quinol monooxygenase YgiN